MGWEVILNNIANWLQQWIGRYIFKGTRLRHQYKERLVEIGKGHRKGSALGAALKAAYLAGGSPAPGIAYLPG